MNRNAKRSRSASCRRGKRRGLTTPGTFVAAMALAAILLTPPVRAQHAAVLPEAKARALQALLQPHPPLRAFCLPCGDTAWKPFPYDTAGILRARPGADEWSLALDGLPVDAAYLYLKRKGRWVHAAAAVGMEFPSLPVGLVEGLREARERRPDSAFAFLTWEGRYSLVDTLRLGDGKHPSTVETLLWIYDRGGALTGKLEASGPETSQRFSLSAHPSGDTLELSLQGYLKENFGTPYPLGARLFDLVRIPGGTLLTRWHAWSPESAGARAAGFRHDSVDPYAAEE